MFLIALVMLATTDLTGGGAVGEVSLSLSERLERLEETVRGLASQPYCYTCGYQSVWLQPDSVIQYERLLYQETNTLSSLNISQGIFTADTPGVWKVDWSLVTEPEDGEENNIFLYRDGEKIGEYS